MIDQYPPSNGVLTSLIWRKTAAGGETSLSGYDNASQALSYTPGQEQVYLNGILLVRGDDYTATNGTSITGLAALSANDFVQINCYNNFSVASLPSTSITGEITNSQITSLATSKLTGTIANNQLANSSITINGSAVSLGGSTTIAGGSAQDNEPTSPTEGQLWLDTNGTLATTGFTEKATLTTTGDIYYASGASTPARLGIGSTGQVLTVSGGVPAWGSAPAPTFNGARVYRSSTFTLPSGAYTTIDWNAETYDTNSYHDNSTNSSRLTVPSTGYYQITAGINITFCSTVMIARIYKNGNVLQDFRIDQNNAATEGSGVMVTCTFSLAANDYIQVAIYHLYGSNSQLVDGETRSYFMIERVGI